MGATLSSAYSSPRHSRNDWFPAGAEAQGAHSLPWASLSHTCDKLFRWTWSDRNWTAGQCRNSKEVRTFALSPFLMPQPNNELIKLGLDNQQATAKCESWPQSILNEYYNTPLRIEARPVNNQPCKNMIQSSLPLVVLLGHALASLWQHNMRLNSCLKQYLQ